MDGKDHREAQSKYHGGTIFVLNYLPSPQSGSGIICYQY